MPEQGVQSLAAGNAILLSIAAAVCLGDEMLDASVAWSKVLLAEEARAALGKQQSVEWFSRHNAHYFDPISSVVHRESLRRMGIPPEERRNVGGFTEGQRRYLEFHREAVFLEARVKA